jgi:hypothetical protein
MLSAPIIQYAKDEGSLNRPYRSWMTYFFYLVNITSATIAFTGLTYNIQTVFLLIDQGEFFVPLVYMLFVFFWIFNICFLLKGVSNNDSWKWVAYVEFFEVVSWITLLVFIGLNVGLFYFGEYVETSHEAFILLLFWINGFVGPFVLVAFGFLGLLRSQYNDLNVTL